MSLVSGRELYDVIDATWPAAATSDCGPFRIRDGKAGQRVSAATVQGAFETADIAAAEDAMRALGQVSLSRYARAMRRLTGRLRRGAMRL